MIHIHQPQSWLGRSIRRCTTCGRRRRFVVRVFEWYAPVWTCGGCGFQFISEAGRQRASLDLRTRRRAWVRETWPAVPKLDDALRQSCEAIR